jgi:HK97 family phage prohead protease
MAVSDKPWDFPQSAYSPEQWRAAALIDTGEGDPDSKDRFKLPVKEPDGAVNRNGVHAAAGRIHAVEGVSAEIKAAAARKLVKLYKNELKETPPDALVELAGDGGRSVDNDGDRIQNFGGHDAKGAPEVERLYVSSFRGFETKGSPLEVRSVERRTIGGYAAVFNKRSVNLGGFHEILDPRTFNKSRSDGFPGVVCRFNHNDDYLLGTTRSGTCRVDVDHNGLSYEVDVPQCRSDVYEMTERRDLAHSSFAFQAYEDAWGHDESGYPVRMLVSARLIDVAPVTNPAYPDATVGLRSLARHMDASFEDVVAKAQKDELRSFFIRTDNRTAPAPETEPEAPAMVGKFGPSALMEILARRADDPIGKTA